MPVAALVPFRHCSSVSPGSRHEWHSFPCNTPSVRASAPTGSCPRCLESPTTKGAPLQHGTMSLSREGTKRTPRSHRLAAMHLVPSPVHRLPRVTLPSLRASLTCPKMLRRRQPCQYPRGPAVGRVTVGPGQRQVRRQLATAAILSHPWRPPGRVVEGVQRPNTSRCRLSRVARA